MNPGRPHRRQRGFTLIELLVAITLASLAAVLGAAVLKAGVDYVGRAREYLREQEDFHATSKIMRHLWQGRTADNFLGFADRLEFSTRRIDSPPNLLATRVRLSCRLDSDEHYALHREFLAEVKAQEKALAALAENAKATASKPPGAPPAPAAATPPAPAAVSVKVEWKVVAEEDLMKGLQACAFSYLRTSDDKAKEPGKVVDKAAPKTAAWQPAWLDGPPPRMLRLNISLRRGALPPLIFIAG